MRYCCGALFHLTLVMFSVILYLNLVMLRYSTPPECGDVVVLYGVPHQTGIIPDQSDQRPLQQRFSLFLYEILLDYFGLFPDLL